MSYVEMEIDSLRHAMHKDEWVILLKDRAGQRYLPVYVDKVWADALIRVMKGEVYEDVIDAEIEQMLAIGDDVRLLIDDAGNSTFKARFAGQAYDVECGVGMGLAVAARGGVGIVCGRGGFG